MSILFQPYFHDEEAAYTHLESVVWKDGSACLHCCGVDPTIKPKRMTKRSGYHNKHKVLSLVDRSTGKARSMVSVLKTDEAAYCTLIGRECAGHDGAAHNKANIAVACVIRTRSKANSAS